MLEETRQLALQVQEEAVKDAEFDIAHTDRFIEKFQEKGAGGNLKRSAPTGIHARSPKRKKGSPAPDEEGGEKKVKLYFNIYCEPS